MTSTLKVLCAILLFAAWSALVMQGLTPVEQLVTAIRDALVALGVFTAAMTTPGDPKP